MWSSLAIAGADRVLTMDLHAAQIQGFRYVRNRPDETYLGSAFIIADDFYGEKSG